MKDNKKLTIIALVAAVVCLSIGFAAFSSTLNINSTASINPVNNFKVVFADTVSGNGTVFTSYTTNNVNGTGTNGATGGSAVIDNSDKTSPNLSSVTANFTKPGQSVTYTLYVVDDSNYDAYITEINKVGTKVCTPGNGTTSDLVDDACSGISVSAVLDSSTTLPQTITKKGYKPLVITLTYASDAAAVDGDFTITFEDIEIKAATLSGNKGMLDPLVEDEEEVVSTCDTFSTKSFGSCTYVDSNNDNTINTGEKITCGTESFYAIANESSGKVSMLAEYNLNIAGFSSETQEQLVELTGEEWDGSYACSTLNYQDIHVRGKIVDNDSLLYSYAKELNVGGTDMYVGYGSIIFSDNNYWTIGGASGTLDDNFTPCTGSNCTIIEMGGVTSSVYPIYVYGISNSSTGETDNLKSYVDAYIEYLNSKVNGAGATGRLITYDELENLGCNGSNYSCENAPSWIFQTTYWTASARDSSSIWRVAMDETFGIGADDEGYVRDAWIGGIRPLVTMNTSVISKASA